ncbi:MAG TPA: BON domain-containing protein [Terriglobales bacterium]|nr:BON domain-containing protein [Terriglobales bacterium]
MARIRSLLIGGAVGAVAAYFLDPDEGAVRRARLQGRVEGLAQELQDRAQVAIGRLDASIAALPDDDLSVLNRVESALLAVSGFRRGSIETEVVDGQVVLRGEVASVEEEREVVAAAAGVPGVIGVESLLQLPT